MGELKFSESYRVDKKIAKTAILKKYFAEHLVKTLIQSLLFALLAVYFLYGAIAVKDRMSVFLCAVCISGIAAVVLKPFIEAKSSAAAFGDGFDFKISFYENGVSIERGEKVTELAFDDISKVLELADFIYIESKNRFFPVPKEFFEDSVLEEMRESFLKNLEERYKNRDKKGKN